MGHESPTLHRPIAQNESTAPDATPELDSNTPKHIAQRKPNAPADEEGQENVSLGYSSDWFQNDPLVAQAQAVLEQSHESVSQESAAPLPSFEPVLAESAPSEQTSPQQSTQPNQSGQVSRKSQTGVRDKQTQKPKSAGALEAMPALAQAPPLPANQQQQDTLSDRIAKLEATIAAAESALPDQLAQTLTPELRQRFVSNLELQYDNYIILLMEAGEEERAFNASERIRTITHLYETDLQGVLPETLQLAEVQNEILDDETAILQYAMMPDKGFAWVITQNSMTTYELQGTDTMWGGSDSDGFNPVESYYDGAYHNRDKARVPTGNDGIHSRIEMSDAAARAAQALKLQDVVKQLNGYSRIVIVPDGDLHKLPFDRLPISQSSSGDMLVDHYELVQIPSSTSLAISRAQLKSRKVVSDTTAILSVVYFDWWADLYGVEKEASAVESIVPGETEVMENENVDIPALQSLEANSYKVIHIGTHGIPGAFILSDGQTDIEFTIDQIRDLDWSTNLLVLTHCDGGVGIDDDGNLTVGRAFLASEGIPSVISTKWPVDDNATAVFMTYFYTFLYGEQELSASEALHQAKIAMRSNRKYSHIFYWGGFKLEGNW